MELQFWGAPSLYMERAGPTRPLPKSEVGMCVCTVPQATASCCLMQKGLTVASAARSTGMNFANSLFNHVYGLSVRLSQVGFSAMM